MSIEELANFQEEELLERLGALTLSRTTSPGGFEDPTDKQDDGLQKYLDDAGDNKGFMRELGSRVCKPISESLHKVICLQGDKSVAAELMGAKEAGKVALANYLLLKLVSLGFDTATSLFVASIVAGVLIASGTDRVCEAWAGLNNRL